jgi:hypothetical protein
MPSLQVRELPENLYNLLQKKAKESCRSLSGEAIFTHARGLDTAFSNRARRSKLLEQIRENPPVEKKS